MPTLEEFRAADADYEAWLSEEQNLMAWQDAKLWWDGPRPGRIREQEAARREPPVPLAPRLPAFAATSRWSRAGDGSAGGCDVGRAGVTTRDRTEGGA